MRDVVIVEGCRSAFGKMGGGLKKLSASELASFVVKGLTERTKLLEKTNLDGVFAGTAFSACQTNTPGRYTVLDARLPIEVPGTTV